MKSNDEFNHNGVFDLMNLDGWMGIFIPFVPTTYDLASPLERSLRDKMIVGTE